MRTAETQTAVSRTQFAFEYPIGKGGFGKVWRVQQKRAKQTLAMKEMSKARVVAKRSVHSVMSERKLLSVLRHPFIVNMQYAFQDRDNLYLVLDYLPGGDLRYHLARRKRFSEAESQFIIACVLQALEYLHSNAVLHRDIKPENLVLDHRGYVRVTDFGVARVWRTDNAQDTSGTPGYMAPEVMCRQNHGVAADYFAVGVMAYEFMMGRRPYLGRNRKEIRDAILAKQVQVRKQDLPPNWSYAAGDFVNRLLQRKASSRLGFHGPDEVKGHPWFFTFPWRALAEKTLQPPFAPEPGDNFDARVATLDWKDEEEVAAVQMTPGLFDGYYYDMQWLPPVSLDSKSKCRLGNVCDEFLANMAESDYYYSDLDAPDCPLLDGDSASFRPAPKRYGNRASHYVKWSKEEDEKLREAATKHENDWRVIAQFFPGKTTTSLKKRWDLKHNPATKKTKWTQEEDDLILKMKEELGGGFWKAISKSLPGRPADAVKNRYYSVLRRHQNKKNPPEQIQNGHIPDPLPESAEAEVSNVSDEALFGILSLGAGGKDIEPVLSRISKAERMQKVEMLQNTLAMLQLMLEKTKGEIVILTSELNAHGIITEAVPL